MRRAVRIVAAIVVLAGVLLVALYLSLDTAFVRARIAAAVGAALGSPGAEVTIEGLGPGLLGSVTIERIVVADRQGRWLEARKLKMSWSPWRLLAGDLDVASLTVGSVEVLRPPVAAAPAPSASGSAGGPLLPQAPGVAIHVGRLAVGRVTLDTPVIGTPAVFTVSGSASLDAGGAGSAALAVHRIDGVAGSLDLHATVDLATDKVAVKASLSEAPDGIVTGLLGLTQRPALDVDVSAQGTTRDWSGEVAGRLAGMADASLHVTVSGTPGAQSFSLSGTAHPGGLLDAGTLRLVGKEVTWHARGSLSHGRVDFADAGIKLAPGSLSWTGTLGLDSGVLDLDVAANGAVTPALKELAAPWTLASWTASGRITGTLEAPSADVTVALDGAAGEGLATRSAGLHAVVARGQGGAWSLNGEVALKGLTLADPGLAAVVGDAPSLTWQGSVDGAFAALKLDTVEARLAAGDIGAGVDVGLTDGTVTVDRLQSRLKLAALGGLADMQLSGSARLTGALRVEGWGAGLSGNIDLTTQNVATGDPALGAILGSSPSLHARISGDGKRLQLDDLGLGLAVWQASGRLGITMAGLGIDGSLSGPFHTTDAFSREIAPISAGAGTLQASLSGTLEAPRLDAAMHVDKGVFDGVALAGAELDAGSLSLADGLSASLHATLPFGATKLEARADLSIDRHYQRMEIGALSLTGAGVETGGSLSLKLRGGTLLTGRIAGRIAELSKLGPALGGDVGGKAIFEVAMAPAADGSQDVEARARATGLTAQGVTVGSVTLAADISDALHAPALDLNASASGIGLAGATVDRMLVRAKGPLTALAVSVEAKAAAPQPWTLSAAGSLSRGKAATTLEIDRLQAAMAGHKLANKGPLKLSFGAEGVSGGPFALALDGGSAQVSFARSSKGVALQAALDGVPVALAALIDPSFDMTGRLDGKLDLAAGGNGSHGSLSLTASRLVVPGSKSGEQAALTVQGQWDGRRLTFDAGVTGIESVSFQLSASWPLLFDPATGSITVPPGEPVSGKLEASGDLASLVHYLPLRDQVLSGRADIALRFSGPAGDPTFAGKAAIDGGHYENLTYGTIVDNIRLNAHADSQGHLVLDMTGSDGGSGKVKAEATAQLTRDGAVKLDAKLNLDNAQVVRRDDAKATANGDITYKGTLLHGAIVGRLQMAEVDINVAQKLPSNVTVLKVEDVFANGAGEAPSAPRSRPWRASLDIIIDMPRRVFVRGRGLESEWSGKVTIGGTTSKPQVSATMSLVRGTLTLVGRTFDLTSGSVSLEKGDAGDPRFDIVATSNAGGVNGTLRVHGQLSAPQLDVTTVPPLPEDEALARMLFGKASSSLNGLEALQVASAIAQITGTSTGGSGILDRARAALGIDVLTVESGPNGQTRVGAGRYVATGVYVGVRQGIAAQSSAVVVDIDLTNNITVQTEAGSNASGRVGIDWKWDY